MLLMREEAFLIAVNIARLPSMPRQILKDIPRPPNSASRTIEGRESDVAADANASTPAAVPTGVKG